MDTSVLSFMIEVVKVKFKLSIKLASKKFRFSGPSKNKHYGGGGSPLCNRDPTYLPWSNVTVPSLTTALTAGLSC